MLIDMIHDNHAEPPFKTRYRDPALLRRLGYQAIVIPDALTALPSARDDAPTATPNPARLKPADLEAAIDARLRAALDQGMQVYFYADALLLPRTIVDKRPADFLCDDASGRLCPARPAVFESLQDQVEELFDRWPAAAGLVMRTGEVYPEATPHMVGSPLHAGACSQCRGISPLEREARFIRAMHQTVIAGRQKQYIHRAWQPNIPGTSAFHDDPQPYLELSRALPESPHLIFSFKFTRGDFRHPAAFNPCLLADGRPKWIEFQCEREYEGKGAFPNYQAPAWRAFFDHLRAAGIDAPSQTFGIWGWSRGGGWGGPYAQREEWIDSNVHALARLHQNPAADAAEIASAWVAETFGIAESSPATPALVELLLNSAPTIRRLFYVSALANKDAAAWVKDDLLDVEAIWQSATRAVEAGVSDQATAEKQAALAGEGAQGGIDRMRHLFAIAQADLPNKSQARDLDNSLTFFSSFAAAITSLFIGFTAFQRWTRDGKNDATLAANARRHLEAAQAQWLLHTQRHALLPGAPSVFHENSFWERTNECLELL